MHVIAAAEDNDDLKSFLDCIACRPNLTAIASTGMPSGSGRKGGKAKRKRNRSTVLIETRSTRPCLLQSSSITTQLTSLPAESSLSTGQPYQSSSAIPGPIPKPINQSLLYKECHLTASTPSTSPATDKTPVSSSGVQVSNPIASTSGQVLVGGSGAVFNISSPSAANPPMPAIILSAVHVQLQTTPTVSSSCSRSSSFSHTNPFVLKFKTNLIKICQSCRKGYEGLNDTMGLVVARAERRMISNVVTGVQFLNTTHTHTHTRTHTHSSFHQPSLLTIPTPTN